MDTEAELPEMVRDAVAGHFDEAEQPGVIRLHLVREEVMPGVWFYSPSVCISRSDGALS